MRTEGVQAIWNLLDAERGKGAIPRSAAEIVGLANASGIAVDFDALWAISARLGPEAPLGLVPPPITSFIVKLLSDVKSESVLDPWVGLGSMLGPVSKAVGATRIVGRHPNVSTISAASDLLPGADLAVASVGAAVEVFESLGTFAVVVSCPPFNMRGGHFSIRGVDFSDYRGLELLARSADRLADDGIGVFVVPSSFLFDDGEASVRRGLAKIGLRLDALIDVPAGGFRPATMIPTLVAVVRRGPSDGSVFVGQLADDEQQLATLLSNLRKRRAGARPELGAIVRLDGYRGLKPYLIAKELEKLGRRFPVTRLGDVATVTSLKSKGSPPEDGPDAFYLPLFDSGAIRERREDLPGSGKGYAHVLVDPAKANARVVSGFLDSPHGLMYRELVATGVTLSRISLRDVVNMPLWLPPVEKQNVVSEVEQRIRVLSDELSGLREQLWDRLDAVQDVQTRLSRVNHEDSFQEWVDSLPFPLSSVLWTYHTLRNQPLKCYLQLDYFFEALAQYLAVVLMSGVHRDAAMFTQEWEQVEQVFDKNCLSLKRSTFGTWMAIYQKLAKSVRAGATGDRNARDNWLRLFAIEDEKLLVALVDKGMVALLQKANKYRNDWRGHGGVVGDDEAARRQGHLEELLSDFRHLVGLRWKQCPLVLPVSGRFIGGVHRYTVKMISGVRVPFDTMEMDLKQPLEDGRLHMVSARSGEVCPLLPFVKLGPSPKDVLNACYFFNRLDGRESRWVSFHFEQRPELVESGGTFLSILDALTASRPPLLAP